MKNDVTSEEQAQDEGAPAEETPEETGPDSPEVMKRVHNALAGAPGLGPEQVRLVISAIHGEGLHFIEQ